MKAAYTGWTWLVNHNDNHIWEFEQFLKEMADLGYKAVENFAFIKGYFKDDAKAVSDMLKKYDIELVNLYQHLSDDPAKDLENTREYIGFMKEVGATYLNLQAVMWNDAPNDRPMDIEALKQYASLSDEIGRLCRENGLVACFHPHANTHVFREEEIDYLMENTNPENLGLCLDTAHTLIGGMDVVKAVEKYADRIVYVHLKDVDPDESVSPEWPMNRFMPLGCGTIDFKGVHKALKTHGYDGILCVELDKPPVCNYRAAQVSAEYLHNVLGLM